MKKLFSLAFAMILLLSSPAYAQLKWGVKGGATFSSIPLSKLQYDASTLTGFHLGPMVEFRVPLLPIAVDASVLFSQKGGKITKESVSEVIKTNYIDIPLHVKLRYGLLPTTKFIALAGPAMAIRLSDNVENVAKDLPNVAEIEAKKVGFGINVGLGVELLSMIQLTAQYTAPLSDDYQLTGLKGAADDFVKAKNKIFSVSVGILF